MITIEELETFPLKQYLNYFLANSALSFHDLNFLCGKIKSNKPYNELTDKQKKLIRQFIND